MSTVVQFPGAEWGRLDYHPRSRDLEPKAVVEGMVEVVAETPLLQLVVIGLTEENEIYAAASSVHIADTLLLIDRFRQKLMRQFEGDEFTSDDADEPA